MITESLGISHTPNNKYSHQTKDRQNPTDQERESGMNTQPPIDRVGDQIRDDQHPKAPITIRSISTLSV